MIRYFEERGNEQLIPQKQVASELRTFLDVPEALKCMIYGKPKEVPHEKLALYVAYCQGEGSTGKAVVKE